MKIVRTILGSLALAFTLVTFQNCSPPASSARGPAGNELQSPQNSGGTITDNPKPTVDVSIMPHSIAQISAAQICVEDVKFRRVNVKNQNGYASPNELNRAAKDVARSLRGRDITIVQAGAYIDAFRLVRGDFNVVELVLDNECAADRSLTLKNSNGNFGTKEKITLRFDGNINADGGTHLQLNMQPFLEALTKVQSGVDIRRAIQDVRGTFH